MVANGGRMLTDTKEKDIPSRKGSRPWRSARKSRSSSMLNVPSMKVTAERREELRAKRKVLADTVRDKKEELKREKEAERDRIKQKRKQKEENRLKSAKGQMITNPNTLKKMSKKQLKKLVRV